MRSILFFLIMVTFLNPPVQSETFSKLWGVDGEAWSSEGRLPDFSFAGYRRGERPIPAPRVTHDVTDFGATGDDDEDDSDAFIRALSEISEGVLFVPAGRYIITKMLTIDKPNVVIRGAGPDKTTLYFPIPLNDIKPNWGATTSGQRTSNYSWSGGFISIVGSYRSKELTSVDAVFERGQYEVTVSDGSNLKVGQEIDLKLQDDTENSLANHLYSDDPRTSLEKLKGRVRASLITKITAIDGDKISIDRPLRFDTEARWNPTVYRFAPTVTDSGIESVRFEFPNNPYDGHFSELGFNAFVISNAAHCWVRDVHIHNADSGGFISGHFNTVQGVTYTSERTPDSGRKSTGHHGLTNGGNDNLFLDFDYQTTFIHDITVSRSSGNVHKNGRGIDLALDHHRHAPYENLFTNIDVGKGVRIWRCGGGADLGAHCAGRGTFWNISADRAFPPPNEKFGPWSMNFVGVEMNTPDSTAKRARWYEHSGEGLVHPRDLHEAQLEKRLSGLAE